MGAHNIEFILPKSKYPTETDVKRWYNEAVEQARYEDGHSPYSGTIATTRGVAFFYPAFDNEDDAISFVLEKGEKWGKLACVELNTKQGAFWYLGGWAAS